MAHKNFHRPHLYVLMFRVREREGDIRIIFLALKELGGFRHVFWKLC